MFDNEVECKNYNKVYVHVALIVKEYVIFMACVPGKKLLLQIAFHYFLSDLGDQIRQHAESCQTDF
ncbi:hypothetical protein HNR50_001097 [Spirochaeta isovalerica]|uniref:Uncharacterized protein n=1 Tax=Spirochaeta isovalerica TaxID=150 RepID=A0A841R908_9SPIO|nr:hypothetical protein [Spirochaeta isovalerica]